MRLVLRQILRFLVLQAIWCGLIFFATIWPVCANPHLRVVWTLGWAIGWQWIFLLLVISWRTSIAIRSTLRSAEHEWLDRASLRAAAVVTRFALERIDGWSLDLDSRRQLARTIWLEWQPDLDDIVRQWRSVEWWTQWVPPGLAVFIERLLDSGLRDQIEPWLEHSIASLLAQLPPLPELQQAGASMLAESVRSQTRSWFETNLGDLVHKLSLAKRIWMALLWVLFVAPAVGWLALAWLSCPTL